METSELSNEQLKLREGNLYICPCCKDVKSVKDAYFYQNTSFVYSHTTYSIGRMTKHYDTSTYLVRLCESCFRKQVRKSKIEYYMLIFFVTLFAVLGAVLGYILFHKDSVLSGLIILMLIYAVMCGGFAYYTIGWLYKLIHYFSDKKFKFERIIGNNAIENIHGADESKIYAPIIASVKKI